MLAFTDSASIGRPAMSKRSKVEQSRNGFVLVEVLAALTIALILFAVLSEGFSTVWNRARRPGETTWALALARRVATSMRNGADLDSGDIGNFHYETISSRLQSSRSIPIFRPRPRRYPTQPRPSLQSRDRHPRTYRRYRHVALGNPLSL